MGVVDPKGLRLVLVGATSARLQASWPVRGVEALGRRAQRRDARLVAAGRHWAGFPSARSTR